MAVRVSGYVAVAVEDGAVVDDATGIGVAARVGGMIGVGDEAVDAVTPAVAVATVANVLVADAGVGLANTVSVATVTGVAVVTAWPEADAAGRRPTSTPTTISADATSRCSRSRRR